MFMNEAPDMKVVIGFLYYTGASPDSGISQTSLFYV